MGAGVSGQGLTHMPRLREAATKALNEKKTCNKTRAWEKPKPASDEIGALRSARGIVTYAAASTLCSAHWPQISLNARTSLSISSSECTGPGVMRSRSVPTGTVG